MHNLLSFLDFIADPISLRSMQHSSEAEKALQVVAILFWIIHKNFLLTFPRVIIFFSWNERVFYLFTFSLSPLSVN